MPFHPHRLGLRASLFMASVSLTEPRHWLRPYLTLPEPFLFKSCLIWPIRQYSHTTFSYLGLKLEWYLLCMRSQERLSSPTSNSLIHLSYSSASDISLLSNSSASNIIRPTAQLAISACHPTAQLATSADLQRN